MKNRVKCFNERKYKLEKTPLKSDKNSRLRFQFKQRVSHRKRFAKCEIVLLSSSREGEKQSTGCSRWIKQNLVRTGKIDKKHSECDFQRTGFGGGLICLCFSVNLKRSVGIPIG